MLIQTDIYKRIVAAKLFIDNNYYETINLEQISKQAYFSKFHFHRLFTSIYNVTPNEYLTAQRIHHAKILLSKEGLSISDVCNSVGFESLASFSILFKKRNGYAPLYYRNLAYLKNKLQKEQPKRFIPHCVIQQFGVEQSKNR
jgi:AraC-like DNA-binding protein